MHSIPAPYLTWRKYWIPSGGTKEAGAGRLPAIPRRSGRFEASAPCKESSLRPCPTLGRGTTRCCQPAVDDSLLHAKREQPNDLSCFGSRCPAARVNHLQPCRAAARWDRLKSSYRRISLVLGLGRVWWDSRCVGPSKRVADEPRDNTAESRGRACPFESRATTS